MSSWGAIVRSALKRLMSKAVIGHAGLRLDAQMHQCNWSAYGNQAQIVANRPVTVIAYDRFSGGRKSDSLYLSTLGLLLRCVLLLVCDWVGVGAALENNQ